MQVGEKVRNVKTRVVGTIDTISGDDVVMQVGLFGDFAPSNIETAEKITCRSKDIEPLNEEEYRLVVAFKTAQDARKEADKTAKELASAQAEAEEKLLEYMRVNSIETTKGYDGVGIAAIDGMKVMPSITEENKAAAFAALRAMGRGEVIKEGVHPSTLSSLVSEFLDNGTPVPAEISYFLKPKLKITKK